MAKTDFNSTLVSARLNLALKNRLVGTSVVNRNWEGDIQKVGDTVQIVRPTGTTIRAYSNDTDITVDEVDASAKQLVADQGNYFAFYMHDDENASAYINAFIDEDFYRLINEADKYILGHVDDAPVGNVVSFDPGSDDFLAKVREARAVLSKNNVPEDGRFLVIGPDELNLVEEKLAARTTSMGDDTIRAGYAGQLSGFNVFVSPNLTEDDDATDQFRHNMFGHISAITYADAIVNIETMRSERRFADMVRGLHVFGSEVVRPEALGDLSHKFAAV